VPEAAQRAVGVLEPRHGIVRIDTVLSRLPSDMPAIRVTHIGGPTVLIEAGGWRILTDPTFDAPGRKYKFGWGASSRKQSGPAIAADELGPVDVVLLTHDHHADNFDDAGRSLTAGVDLVVTTASGAARLGRGARGLEAWQTTRLEAPGRPSIDVTATPCRHGPPLSHPIIGDVIGFALRWDEPDAGDEVLWITGDTVLYDGVREVADRLRVGVALVHLGAVKFPVTGPIRYTMTAHDAVELCGLVKPRVAIPVHYEGWSHFSEGRRGIEEELEHAPAEVREAIRWVPIGETVEVH
jgi:L-ascorbate metabolism protein UlaG (beta-lactamase superfamily)